VRKERKNNYYTTPSTEEGGKAHFSCINAKRRGPSFQQEGGEERKKKSLYIHSIRKKEVPRGGGGGTIRGGRKPFLLQGGKGASRGSWEGPSLFPGGEKKERTAISYGLASASEKRGEGKGRETSRIFLSPGKGGLIVYNKGENSGSAPAREGLPLSGWGKGEKERQYSSLSRTRKGGEEGVFAFLKS